MSELKITGNPAPVVGKEESYSVNQLLPTSIPTETLNGSKPNPFEFPVEWSVHVLENGKWIQKEENNKTGNKVSYKFIQKSLERKGIRILAKKGEQTARLDVKPHNAESPKIDSIEFLDKNGNKPTKPFAYGQILKARVHCLHMERRTVYATLWEDDVAGAGHNKANEKNKMKTLPGIVKNGIADIDFVLEPDFAKIANAVKAKGDADEGKTHEYYVTAEILNKKTASTNTNVANPSYKDTTAKPATPKKATPAQKKGPSKKQEKEKSILDDVIDWWEGKVKIEPIVLPNPIDAINSVLKIFTPDKKDDEKTEKGVCVCKQDDLTWGGHPNVSCEFRKKVVEISKRQDFDPNHLMAVMWVESAKTFSTSKIELKAIGHNSKGKVIKDYVPLSEKEIKSLPVSFSGAVGLIQFTPVAIDELNNFYNYSLTKRKLALMTQIEQLYYVEKYIEYWKKANKIKVKLTLADLYLLVFAPSKMNGSIDSTTLYKEGTVYYKANESVDTDKKNGITKKELAHRAYESFEEGNKKQNKATKFTCIAIKEKEEEKVSSSGVLAEMKIIADSHRQYLQETNKNRTADTEAGLAKMDCSEFVSRYLHKLGVTKNIIYMTTANMTTQAAFRSIIDNDNIDLVEGSKLSTFKPQKGDIFAWGRLKNGSWGGHTGVIYDYDNVKDTVTIMEAIGKSGAVGERKQVKNGGYSGTNSTRTAVYDRLGGALYGHDGWFGYYRPNNYTKKL